MSWACPTCGREWNVPPKWCGCTKLELDPPPPDTWSVVIGADRADEVTIDADVAAEVIEQFGLAATIDPPPPFLRRRWMHHGVETIVEDGEDRVALPPAALAFLRERR